MSQHIFAIQPFTRVYVFKPPQQPFIFLAGVATMLLDDTLLPTLLRFIDVELAEDFNAFGTTLTSTSSFSSSISLLLILVSSLLPILCKND